MIVRGDLQIYIYRSRPVGYLVHTLGSATRITGIIPKSKAPPLCFRVGGSNKSESERSSLWPPSLSGALMMSTGSLNPPWHAMSESSVPLMDTDPVTQEAPSPAAVREGDNHLRALTRYLHTHQNAATKLERSERQLRDIVLHAAEGGLLDAMEKAFPALRRMYVTHPAWPSPFRVQVDSRPPLDFHDHKVSLTLCGAQ